MKKIIYFFLLIFFSSVLLSATYFSESEKKELLGPIKNDCFKRQRSVSANDFATDQQITKYCTCIANEVLDAPNAKEVFIGIENGDVSPTYYKNLILSAANYCSKQAMK